MGIGLPLIVIEVIENIKDFFSDLFCGSQAGTVSPTQSIVDIFEPSIDDVVEKSETKIEDKIEILSDTKEKVQEKYPDYKYWSVIKENGVIFVGMPLSYIEARGLVEMDQNILCIKNHVWFFE